MKSEEIAKLNAAIFGRGDDYSKAETVATTQQLIRKDGKRIVAYLLWKDLGDYISIVRVGTLKTHRKKGAAKSLYRAVKRIAKKANKPIRTYLAYENLASYRLHIGTGFKPTHVAWKRWIWVEYTVNDTA